VLAALAGPHRRRVVELLQLARKVTYTTVKPLRRIYNGAVYIPGGSAAAPCGSALNDTNGPARPFALPFPGE
jgi:hypothetical protein